MLTEWNTLLDDHRDTATNANYMVGACGDVALVQTALYHAGVAGMLQRRRQHWSFNARPPNFTRQPPTLVIREHY